MVHSTLHEHIRTGRVTPRPRCTAEALYTAASWLDVYEGDEREDPSLADLAAVAAFLREHAAGAPPAPPRTPAPAIGDPPASDRHNLGILADPPRETTTRLGPDVSLWRTALMGAIPAGGSCATCGDGRKLSVYTAGPPQTGDNPHTWWHGLDFHCSAHCWGQHAGYAWL
jgi:hypothetical protein